jgi:hypothetical protein
MVFLLAIGFLLWIAFLLAALLLCCIIWVLCKQILWLMKFKPGLTGRRPAVSSKRNEPRVSARAEPRVHARAEPQIAPDIWPKWTASHKRYMDGELSSWQKQFDALNSRE